MTWLIDFFKNLFNPQPKSEGVKTMTRYISTIPKHGDMSEDVKVLKAALNEHGATLDPTNNYFGPSTLKAVQDFQKSKGLTGSGQIGPQTLKLLGLEVKEAEKPKPVPAEKTPRWMIAARAMLGKKETDPAFNKEMSAKWSLFGMNLGTISTSWAAWCGLFVAVVLSSVGLQYAKDGSLARNWGKYGVAIDYKTHGIPEGAIVWINGKGDCKSSSNNHVTFANGDCTPADLAKPGATFGGLDAKR